MARHLTAVGSSLGRVPYVTVRQAKWILLASGQVVFLRDLPFSTQFKMSEIKPK